MRGEHSFRPRGEATAEVGTHQIVLPVRGRTRDVEDRHAEPAEVGDQARGVERRVHRVARAGMRELKFEERTGRERSAGALEPDACCGQPAQAGPWIVRHAWRPMRRPTPGWRFAHDVNSPTTRGAGSGCDAGGCGPPGPSSPGGRATPRIPGPADGAGDPAWQARRGTRCSDSRA